MKVFVIARAMANDFPSDIPRLDPPLKKHQHTHNDRVANVIYVGLFGSKCSEYFELNLCYRGFKNNVVINAPIPADA